MDQKQKHAELNEDFNARFANKSTSLGSLIAWNISKVLEKSPHIDLKSAIKAAQVRLEADAKVVISQCAEERHLECALLAWQQLGHTDAESLYKFYDTKKIEQERKASVQANKISEFLKILDINPAVKHKESKQSKATDSASFNLHSVGPVVKLPVETKIIMRMENSGNLRQPSKKPKANEKNIMNKIDAVCCLDSGCIERLSTLDATTSELRSRAAKLAQREAERAELLERAEAAWKNLELGYHRRLTLAEEKEDDIYKQVQKLIEERNSYKSVCTTLVQQLKEQGEAAEKGRAKLTEVEKSVYDRACVRLRLSEQVAKGDSALAEQYCRGAQVDRDLQFKEEEARRKLHNIESELESTRVLTHDAERAMRNELGALKEQVTRVSQLLLAEDADSRQYTKELEELQSEKMGIVEDLDGCKLMCENRMQGKLSELKKKQLQLNDLNNKVIECRCKFPIDATVEVKRTVSLAALCHCTPEEKVLESCSCTSLRSQLLSNLLADLFGGLLTELGWTGSQMPCQLLKCLEDSHNWDRSSVLRTNLRSFFARLLIGELDIAIATSIEKYHAKWVGATCADVTRKTPDIAEAESADWQDCATERRAQKLAAKLAEQLFQDRADELAQRAKEIVTSGPPPCECRPQPAVYPCIVKQSTITAGGPKSGEGISPYWRRTLNDVTQLRLQVESLKKDSIKKADLKTMEEKIAKLVERTSVQDTLTLENDENTIKSTKPLSLGCIDAIKQSSFINNPKKGNKKLCNMKLQRDKSVKPFNKLKQTFAVNLCLCGTQTATKRVAQLDKRLQDTNIIQNDDLNAKSWQQKPSNAPLSQISSIKKTKPITSQLPNTDISNANKQGKTYTNTICKKECVCFHKKPSNTSINKLLKTIAKWKTDLTVSSSNQENKYTMNKNTISSEKSMKSKTNSKVSYEFNQELENQVIKSRKSFPSKEKEQLINNPEVQQFTPRTTESEYIGEVNLDKSNHSFCKCNDNDDKKNLSCEIPHKCISIKKCCCKKSDAISNFLPEKTLPTDLALGGRDVIPAENGDQNQTEDLPTETGIKSKDLFSCDCDLTLLGVTVTRKNNNKRKTPSNQGGYNDDDYDTDRDCDQMSKLNNNTFQRRDRASRKGRRNNLDEFIISCNKPPNCECQDNCNEMKDRITCMYTKAKDDFILNVDKGIDVNDTIKGEPESQVQSQDCVCCKMNNVVETENLEENTFHLLQEHLKEKLNEFKRTSCNSSCIPPEDEEKLFSKLIKKVKHIILDTTNNVSCRCSSMPPIDSSWNRANSLLQEYLKAKIKILQCQCTQKEDPSPVENVLDKVSKLIEHDFNRLKSICKCKSMNQSHGINAAGQVLWEQETPVKDKPQINGYLANDEKQYTYGPEKGTTIESERDSLKSIIVTENMSSQVPLNLGMETKSCNAIEKDSVIIQTSEIRKISGYNECGSTETKSHYDCCCDTFRSEYVPTFGFRIKELLVNHCTNVTAQEHNVNRLPKYLINRKSYSYPGLDSQRCPSTIIENHNVKINNETNTCNKNCNANKTVNLPYVGYTVDCSCDRTIGSCVCRKSIVQANNDQIVDMWKTYINYNKTNLKAASYIMHKATFKPTMITDQVPEELKRLLNQNTEKNTHEFCEVNLSTYGDEDITLKESRKNIESVKSAACVFTDAKDSLDWCECSSKPVKVLNTELGNTICSQSSDILEREMGDDVALNQLPKNCNCAVVPICHVKMLVENIEHKLLQSQCTCDSLLSVVCPVHSSALF